MAPLSKIQIWPYFMKILRIPDYKYLKGLETQKQFKINSWITFKRSYDLGCWSMGEKLRRRFMSTVMPFLPNALAQIMVPYFDEARGAIVVIITVIFDKSRWQFSDYGSFTFFVEICFRPAASRCTRSFRWRYFIYNILSSWLIYLS